MPFVYRSVRVVIQNSTEDLLTVEGSEVLLGAWSAELAIRNGETVAPQSARAFATESVVLQRGTEAFVRFGSVSGYVHLHWLLPWVGEFKCEVGLAPGERHFDVRINDDEPAAVAVLVTLARGAAPAAAPTTSR